MGIGEKPAFPVFPPDTNPWDGMTYRQWLIGMAMQGLLAGDVKRNMHCDEISSEAIEQADSILEQLDGEEGG